MSDDAFRLAPPTGGLLVKRSLTISRDNTLRAMSEECLSYMSILLVSYPSNTRKMLDPKTAAQMTTYLVDVYVLI